MPVFTFNSTKSVTKPKTKPNFRTDIDIIQNLEEFENYNNNQHHQWVNNNKLKKPLSLHDYIIFIKILFAESEHRREKTQSLRLGSKDYLEFALIELYYTNGEDEERYESAKTFLNHLYIFHPEMIYLQEVNERQINLLNKLKSSGQKFISPNK